MSNLKAVAQLEHNVVGCILSIRIPSADIAKLRTDKSIVDINCKHLFNKLCKATVVPNEAGVDPLPPATKLSKIANRYDNIIDQLERKYYCESMVQANKDADNNSDDGSEGSDVSEAEDEAAPASKNAEGEEQVAGCTKPKVKSNKRKIFSEDYDMEDPFIDDEEMIVEVEASLKTSRTKTKHDGFFVSSGKLEVFSPKKVQKVSNVTTSKAAAPAPVSVVSTTVVAPVPVKVVAIEGEGGETVETKKKRKRRTKKEMEEATLGKSAPSASPLTALPTEQPTTQNANQPASNPPAPIPIASTVNVDGEEVIGSPDGPIGFVTKVRVEKVLPPWSPCEEILQAMEAFKTHFESTKIKLFKSSHIPKVLEEPLHEVDLVVLKTITPESLQRTSGYYEGLHQILGGELLIGKLRSLMIRLRLRDRAGATLQAIDAKVDSLVAELKSVVVPCPEKMQPAYKAAKRAQTALIKATEGGAGAKDSSEVVVDGGNEEEDLDGGEELPVPAAQEVSAPTVHTVAGTDTTTGTAVEASATSPKPPTPTQTQAQAQTSGAANSQAVGRYEWVCNWSKAMKVKLVAIENELKMWVWQENQYREKLTVHDKKHMDDKDTAVLVEKDIITAYLEGICDDAMPPSCLQGTVAYLRRISTTLNKPPKDKTKDKDKAAKPTASVASESGGATSSVGGAITAQDNAPDPDDQPDN